MPLFTSTVVRRGSRGALPAIRSSAVLLAAAALTAGCDRAPRRNAPALPLDVRPVMAAMRVDIRATRQAVERGNLRAGLKAIDRLRVARIGGGVPNLPPDFVRQEEELRARAAELAQAMHAGDRARSEAALGALLERCNACHRQWRPLGESDALLR